MAVNATDWTIGDAQRNVSAFCSSEGELEKKKDVLIWKGKIKHRDRLCLCRLVHQPFELCLSISAWVIFLCCWTETTNSPSPTHHRNTHVESSLLLLTTCLLSIWSMSESLKLKKRNNKYLATWITSMLTLWCCCCCCGCRWAAVWGGMDQVSGTLLLAHHRPGDVAGRWAALPGRQGPPGQHCYAGGAALCQW